jgi:MFS family permease
VDSVSIKLAASNPSPSVPVANLAIDITAASVAASANLMTTDVIASEPLSIALVPAGSDDACPTIPAEPSLTKSKAAIRTSLKASTIDGVFATIFSNVTGGVLLTGFLMQLGASPSQIGLLASIPMVANLVQPIGAYLSEQTTSRQQFCFWIYGVSRLLWLILAIAIFSLSWQPAPQSLIGLTLVVALLSGVLGAMGSAPWMSWMAVLVPRQLRGRYFGLRNSAANLANLISLPLLGLAVSKGFGGSIQGYGVVLTLGIMTGLVSLGFQQLIADVNPRHQAQSSSRATEPNSAGWLLGTSPNALLFLLYFSLSMFALNLSAPFFNLYMLDRLALDMSQVTLYNSLTAGANLLLLMGWGNLSDRIGNRSILLSMGVFVAAIPLLWLIPAANVASVWVWLPLLHVLSGGTMAAIDLCTNNLQIGVAPIDNQSTYFGMVAAVAGVTSALGATVGGLLVQYWPQVGFLGVFVLSAILRLVALLPLLLVEEPNYRPLRLFTLTLSAASKET